MQEGFGEREVLMRATAAAFEWVRIEDIGEVLCGCCQSVLDRHQPDPDRPDRMLGTCPECGAWFLIDGDARTMLALPDVRTLRGAR
jgi:hypothetical protein